MKGSANHGLLVTGISGHFCAMSTEVSNCSIELAKPKVFTVYPFIKRLLFIKRGITRVNAVTEDHIIMGRWYLVLLVRGLT